MRKKIKIKNKRIQLIFFYFLITYGVCKKRKYCLMIVWINLYFL